MLRIYMYFHCQHSRYYTVLFYSVLAVKYYHTCKITLIQLNHLCAASIAVAIPDQYYDMFVVQVISLSLYHKEILCRKNHVTRSSFELASVSVFV